LYTSKHIDTEPITFTPAAHVHAG